MVRTHECAGTAAHFIANLVNQPAFRDKHAAFAANPAPFGHNNAFADRFGEVQIEAGGQQKPISCQGVGGVKGGIIEHFEIDRAMCRARSVKHIRSDFAGQPGPTLHQNIELGRV